MGITRSATTLARVVGPIWAGALFHYLGRDWPYYAGALVMGVVVLLGLRMWRVRGHDPAGEPAGTAAAVAAPEPSGAPDR